MTPFLAMLRKDLRLAYRNPMLFGLLVVTPFVMIAVLSEAFSPLYEGRDKIDLPVVDLVGSDQSSRILDALEEGESLDLGAVHWSREAFTRDDAAQLLGERGQSFAVLVISPSPSVPQVTLYADPAQPGLTRVLREEISSRLALEAVRFGLANELVEATGMSRQEAGSLVEGSIDRASESSQVGLAEVAAPGRDVIPSRFEQTVPGFSIMFTFWLATLVAAGIHVEKKEFGTWRRTLASPAPSWVIVCSRILAYVVLGLAQMSLLFLLGGIFFGIELGWNVITLLLIFIALSLVTTSFGFLMISLISDMAILSMVMNLAVIGMALIGGALIPAGFLPDWAEPLSVLTPHYWAMDAVQEVIILEGGVSSVAAEVSILLLFAAGLFALGSLRFRVAE
jgi:ABC-2 type transport system permease protein